MKRLFYPCTFVVAFLALYCGPAQAVRTSSLIASLSACDGTFFSAVHEKQKALTKISSIRQASGSASFIEVPDRLRPTGYTTMFSAQYQDEAAKLLGYYDLVSDFGSAGRYYSWGFIVPGSVEQVKNSLMPSIAERHRLRQVAGAYARSDLWKDGEWRADDSLVAGELPKAGTVERVFLIQDASRDFPGSTFVGCTLQGSISNTMLAVTRPDIDIPGQVEASTHLSTSKKLANLIFGDTLYLNYRSMLVDWYKVDRWSLAMLRCMQTLRASDISDVIAAQLENDLSADRQAQILAFMQTDTGSKVIRELHRQQQKDPLAGAPVEFYETDRRNMDAINKGIDDIVKHAKSPRYQLASSALIAEKYAQCKKSQ